MKIVDTATLAVALGVTSAHVRRLVARNRITPVGHRRTGGPGRPTMLFDLDAAHKAVRGELDEDP